MYKLPTRLKIVDDAKYEGDIINDQTDGPEHLKFWTGQKYERLSDMVKNEIKLIKEDQADERKKILIAQQDVITNLILENRKLQSELDKALNENKRIEALLLDPTAVHINFLNGKIAKLDWDKLEHIHGAHPLRQERDIALSDLEFRRELYKVQAQQLEKMTERCRDLDKVIQKNKINTKKYSNLLDQILAFLKKLRKDKGICSLSEINKNIDKIEETWK